MTLSRHRPSRPLGIADEDPSAAGARLAYRYGALLLAAVAVAARLLVGADRNLDVAGGGRGKSSRDERYLQLYMQRRRQALLNDSSVMSLGEDGGQHEPSRFFDDHFRGDMEFLPSFDDVMEWNASARAAYLREFADPGTGDLLTGEFIDAMRLFTATNGTRRHVVIGNINENWGAFSEFVPNRTVDWVRNWTAFFGTSKDELLRYLGHVNTSAVFTVTHQFIDHPKVFSVPLGLKYPNIPEAFYETSLPNRTNLLFMAISDFGGRPSIAQRITSNFNGTVQNHYRDGTDYFRELRASKFMVCPSGLGWDTYRAWESLVMGTIPVLETYGRQDGFYRTFDDLPVLWVDHYDNVTPSLLEEAYPRILRGARSYKFEKLTNWWWVDLINSFRDGQARDIGRKFQWLDYHQRPTLSPTTKPNSVHSRDWADSWFQELSDARRNQVEALGFTKDIWDEDKLPPGLTERNWSSFTEEDRDVITAFGYNESSWQSLSESNGANDIDHTDMGQHILTR